jgi:hypothetical protein
MRTRIPPHPGREMFHWGTLASVTACYTNSQFDRPTLGRNTLCSSQSPHQMYPLVEG